MPTNISDYDPFPEPVGIIDGSKISSTKVKHSDLDRIAVELLDKTGAARKNEGKDRLTLVPTALIRQTARVLMFGAKKYADHNWRKGFNHTDVMDSLQRHYLEWLDGEDLDPESGLPHLAHMACNIAFLLEFMERNNGVDNRYIHKEARREL